MKRSKRELEAMERLVDAATEVASVFGRPDCEAHVLVPMRDSGPVCVHALDALWAANDEWQEAQLVASRHRKPKPKKRGTRPTNGGRSND
jgi:hypothetical protein